MRSTVFTARIGLVGSAAGFGLAHQNQEIASALAVERWLISDSTARPRRHATAAPRPACQTMWEMPAADERLLDWLRGLQALLFVEHPTYDRLPALARSLGIANVCVPMWEWLHPKLEWLPLVDLMLCPTRFTYDRLNRWRQEYGFTWRTALVPWPIDTRRFMFRLRTECRRFVFVAGTGGALALGHRSNIAYRRKGLELTLAAAERAAHVPIIIYAPKNLLPPVVPRNVQVCPPPCDNRLLYCQGDVCVQPSLWEGLGRPLLECQAAGMPLVTTNAPPMCEHNPLRTIPVELENARLTDHIDIPAARMLPGDLAEVLADLHGRRIGRDSLRARRFIERHHNWQTAGPTILRHIQRAVQHAA